MRMKKVKCLHKFTVPFLQEIAYLYECLVADRLDDGDEGGGEICGFSSAFALPSEVISNTAASLRTHILYT